jgi:hypothetical protein
MNSSSLHDNFPLMRRSRSILLIMRNISEKGHRINNGKPLVMASDNCLAKQYWERFVKSTWPPYCCDLEGDGPGM